MSKKVKRLYAHFKPEHYDLSLSISDDKQSFSGSVKIRGHKQGRPSERITLHQKELKISNVDVQKITPKKDKSAINITRVVKQKALDEVRLHSDATMYPGEYEISMEFTGKITKNMDGIYPCFFESGIEKKSLIATQFESHHAREVFPSIDEPEAKATFRLSLDHAKEEIALSNTQPTKESLKGNRKTTEFKTTPVMSTYLLAFVVGEIKKKETKSKNGVLIRAWATADQVQHTDFALEVAKKSMDFYEDYYDIPFPLKKCDFVALPDFASGAMENWGLITFREQTLLVDEKHTSLNTKQYVALVVAHELTHQWFGNLVTMRWWTDLWLNEGFASWMEYLAVDHIFPEWELWTQFSVDEQQTALKADSLEHTHPIEVEVKHPDEIRTIFDAISYQKGASVIHMLHDYLGPEGFKNGLRHYLKTHLYKNTDTIDLWQALEDVTKKPVKEFMGKWTGQSGFPLLSVSCAQDHLKITQSKFVSNPASKSREDKTLWPTPYLNQELAHILTTKQKTNVPFKNKSAPLKINIGQTGFYRVNYSHEMQQKQLEAIDKNLISDIDRMGLLSDSFETTKAGYQPVNEYLDLLEHFKNEDKLPVWETIFRSVSSVRTVLSKSDKDEELREAMKPFIRDLAKPQYDKLGWKEKPKEKHLDTLMRPIIVSMMAAADDKEVLSEIKKAYRAKIDNKVNVNPNLRGTIYSTTARLGGKKEFEELLKMYKQTSSSDEKLSITAAMTSFIQPELHNKVFELIKSEVIRTQDISYWLAYSIMNRHSRVKTWEWFKENWAWMKETMGTDLSFSRMPLYAARTFADEKLLKDYRKFFTQNMEPMLRRTYAQGLEIVQTNVAWRKRDSKAAIAWFKN